MKRRCIAQHLGKNERVAAFDSRGAQGSLGNEGQATVEFAIVMAAFLVVIAAGAVAYRAFDQGILAEHAVYSASHHLEGDTVGALADVFAY